MGCPILALLLITLGVVTCNDLNYLFSDTSLPAPSLRPTLANGNLGFVAYGDSVHMNGVFNGVGPLSHRARIPNFANVQLQACADSFLVTTGCTYQLDMQKGMFRTIYNDPAGEYYVIHDVYPSRYLHKTIVNRVRIQRLSSQSVIQVPIARMTTGSSSDITFGDPKRRDINGVAYNVLTGKTNHLEDDRYQSSGHDICIIYPELPSLLILNLDKTAEEFSFYTSFTNVELEGISEITSSTLEKTQHEVRMLEMWEKYGITVDGNAGLDRVLKASAFYLSSSLLSYMNVRTSGYPFYGMSPSGLGHGGTESSNYKGHSLWDTEKWMFPTVLLVDPNNARQILHYRSFVSKAAADRANDNEFEGWQFPWESAFTGAEVTPKDRENFSQYQHHITADIAYAARMYFYATHNMNWMQSEGCRLAYETAKFWKSRAEYNEETDLYEIHRVGGPDESSYNVSNNAFTNVVAAHNLLFGEFAGCLCKQTIDSSAAERQKMAEIGLGMTLSYDEEQNFTPQHDGYVKGTTISQADTILLGYPLEYHSFDKSTKSQNLEAYTHVTREDCPSMTWAMYAINHLDVDQVEQANAMFAKSYQPYLQPPYNVWTVDGQENFLSGAGAFLQAVVNGYAGVRVRQDMLTITKPRVLPNTNRLFIPQINYMTSKFSLEITLNGAMIEFTMGNLPLTVIADGVQQEPCASCSYSFKNQLVLQPASSPDLNGCTLRETIIGIKVADQGDGALATGANIFVLAVASILTLLFQRG
ncbi:protein-glucosylgalactosylhydroxylysine glucosidase-like [Culex pipiens pallens]|uniref:protein-glucosylgalactosylhydroxylysine glucosidase-like n=1 Tax=Culex pipiens pallens TaxID=42434 RepID=UPI0019540B56|nr:protein-glucosylgalactosylhydroxylysine glucosidase-like [Culex pipiens pallens]